MAQGKNQDWYIYGSELSPFTLKLIANCDHIGLPYAFAPTQTNALTSLRILRRRIRLINGKLPLLWPAMDQEDEFPLVPYLFGAGGENLYDSTAIAYWLDTNISAEERRIIPDDAALAFATRLIDDYADEFGLYMVHHQRWKVSAASNNAGRRLAREFRKLIGPVQPIFASWFSARQVRRLPYLFSTAPRGFAITELPPSRQPPYMEGFPATHDLLEAAFERLLHILDALLSQQPYILGTRLSLADLSLYGQLAMNLDDPDSAHQIEHQAPTLFHWLQRIRRKEFLREPGSHWELTPQLAPLLSEICSTHVPLMQQNHAAYCEWHSRGETLFNESAFVRGKALYEGTLCGQTFRHVAKSFQSKIWRECHQGWQSLTQEDRDRLTRLLPESHSLDQIKSPVNLIH